MCRKAESTLAWLHTTPMDLPFSASHCDEASLSRPIRSGIYLRVPVQICCFLVLDSRYNDPHMKLAVCIIHNRDKNRIIDELVKAGFKFTIIGSTGGFLREGNTTFLIGTQDEEVPILRQVISDNCQSREQLVNIAPYETNPTAAFVPAAVKVPVGGAVLFLLPVSEFERF